ncbi:MAG: HAMP domain-containing histidine kinase [Euryarchaeota archaeon]|nr:HAMP domain-containing histidine kinase [Euryarchaeota archaeon]
METVRGPGERSPETPTILRRSARFRAAVWAAAGIATFFGLLVILLEAGLIRNREAAARVDVFFTAVLLTSTGLALAAASYSTRGRARWGWAFLTGAVVTVLPATFAYLASEVAGEASWGSNTLLISTYAACMPSAILGILFLSPRVRPGSALRSLLDGLIMAGSMFSIGWILFLGDVFHVAQGNGLERSLTASFPALDILLLTLAVSVAARTKPRERPSLYLLLGGLVLFAAGDAAYAYLQVSGMYVVGGPVDFVYVVGLLCVNLSALRWTEWRQGEAPHEPAPSLIATVTPFAPMPVGIAVVGYDWVRRGALDPFVFWVSMAVVTLLVARALWTIVDNLRLVRRLDETVRFKTDLLRYVSHEAGNPLMPLGIQVTLLKSGAIRPGEPEFRRSLDVIDRNVQRMTALLGEVSDVSRLDAGRLRLSLGREDVAALAETSVLNTAESARAKGITLQLHRPTEGVLADVDAGRIGQVVDNLLSNAIKFTPSGGRIDVRVAGQADGVAIEVADSGIGMAAEQLDGLFVPFGRMHEGTNGAAGSGLGLYISRGIVAEHGGSLNADSPGPGKGTTLRMLLPCRDVPARASAPAAWSRAPQGTEPVSAPTEPSEGPR